jgi:Fe-S cluster biogenesis protein NfuA
MNRDEEEKKINQEIDETIKEHEIPAPAQPVKKEAEAASIQQSQEVKDPETLNALQNAEGTLERQDLMDRIQHTLNKIRPYIQADGGDVQLIDYKDGIVTVSMLGACAGCMAIDATLTDGIQAILIDEVPEVHKVQMLEANPYGYEKI